MKKKGINLENVKIKNKSTILKLLNDQGAMSRKDIAHKVSLTPASVTMLCAELMNDNILIETGSIDGANKVGRKKVMVSINYNYKSILSITIEKKYTYIFVCDLKGDVITHKKIKTNIVVTPYEFLIQLSKECKELLWDSNQNIKNILGIGICIPGIVDRKKGISVHAYGIWKEEVLIKKYMEEFMNCNVEVENNVKAFAEGELIYGYGRKYNNLLFIKWGPGVGSAIIIDNQIYEGKDNKAAEIGHYIIEVDGLKCQCGRNGCLETRVSSAAIVNKISQIYSKEDTPKLYDYTIGDISTFTEDSFMESIKNCNKIPDYLCDELTIKSLNHNIERLARAIVNVITMLSPDQTILFGDIMDNKYIEKRFIENCEKFDPAYNKDYISKSSLNNKSSFIGPTALVARKYFFENMEKSVKVEPV